MNRMQQNNVQIFFTKEERAVFRKVSSPSKIQEFLDAIEYSDESRYRSPRSVIRDGKAHCYDGAIFAAAALQFIGYVPRIVEILPNEHDDDHIIAVFRRETCWGAIAKSNFAGLRYREPVYRSLQELMMSYFESYYNVKRERTMIGYTAPLNLNRFNSCHWQIDDAVMEAIGDALDEVRTYQILSSTQRKQLTLVHKHFAEAGLFGAKETGLFKP
jgi:hypothetical protein